jgi:uroporphyrinogen decarboxylase
LNPIQTTAKGMQPETLKKEFGHDIVFWGEGIDTEQTLPFGTPEQVKAEVRILSQDGGFVFATIHNIQPNVPPENILAMFEALQEFQP